MNTPAAIPPAARLFAWELSLASADSGGFKTPFGRFAENAACIGTLTDITETDGVPSALRISDPTGIITAIPDRSIPAAIEAASGLEPPAFIYVYGPLKIRRRRGMPVIELSAVCIRPVSRAARSSWTASAAASAISRLEQLPPSDLRTEYKEKILAALETIRPEPAAVQIPDEEILELIESLYEGRSANRQRVTDELRTRGMTPQQAADTLLRLMEQGDCYAPKPDLIKVA